MRKAEMCGFEMVRAPSSVGLGVGSAIVAKRGNCLVWVRTFRGGPKYERFTGQVFEASEEGRSVELPSTCRSNLVKVFRFLSRRGFRMSSHLRLAGP